MFRIRLLTLIQGFILVLSITACSKNITFDVDEDSPISVALITRAKQISDISWIPRGDFVTNKGTLLPGETVRGIPYSSVKELEKFVGQYVSFYTFMTAVNNPKSVLYTENVKNPPYHGTNCSSYYGTVCSMAVNYVLGLPYSYPTTSYKNLDCFYLVSPQDIDAAEPGDILLQDGKHVVLILDLIDNRSGVKKINILESSAGSGTRVDSYTRRDLLSRWERDGWELLRYRDLDKLPEVDAMVFNDYPYDTPFNSPMCCSRGDRATFREGEDIVLNNLDGKLHTMNLVRDNQVIESVTSDRADVIISDLSPGIYTFDLSTSEWNNPSVEVLETTVSIERQEDELTVYFSSYNGKPMSVMISPISGNRYLVQPITEEERNAGKASVKIPARSGQMYLRVMFEGQYGSVTNEPIAL